MPLILAALIGALIQAAGSLVGRVLISLCIGYVAFKGVDTSIGLARDAVIQNISALPLLAVQVCSAAKVGKCISILTSALLARLSLQGLTGGTLKKMVVK